MTLALCLLGASVIALLYWLWCMVRDKDVIAFKYTDFLQERLRSADVERDRLLTRIQNFEPVLTPPPGQPQSQAAIIRELDAPKEYDETDLEKRGLVPNGDGRVVEIETGRLWENPDELDRWIAFKKAKGLPDDADPREYQGRLE